MANSIPTLAILDALVVSDAAEVLIDILSENKLTTPAKGKEVIGSNKTDIILGNDQNNVVTSKGGSDIVITRGGDDVIRAGGGNDLVLAGAGNDNIAGGLGDDFLSAGSGTDTVLGGAGNDIIVGGTGIDNLTGGSGSDRFVYSGDPFANGTPGGAGAIKVLNQPDEILDYEIGQDKLVLKDLGVNVVNFQKGVSSQLTGDGNIIVLTDGFANAGAAAQAIANNNAVTADEGAFVYFNTTLGISRLAFSDDLGDGGKISVLANLRNQTNVANQANFTANDFSIS